MTKEAPVALSRFEMVKAEMLKAIEDGTLPCVEIHNCLRTDLIELFGYTAGITDRPIGNYFRDVYGIPDNIANPANEGESRDAFEALKGFFDVTYTLYPQIIGATKWMRETESFLKSGGGSMRVDARTIDRLLTVRTQISDGLITSLSVNPSGSSWLEAELTGNPSPSAKRFQGAGYAVSGISKFSASLDKNPQINQTI